MVPSWTVVTRVPRGGSFIHMGPPKGSYFEAIGRDPKPLKVGLPIGNWGRTAPVPEIVLARVQTTAKLLQSLGHHVEEFDASSLCDWESLLHSNTLNLVGMRALLPQQ